MSAGIVCWRFPPLVPSSPSPRPPLGGLSTKLGRYRPPSLPAIILILISGQWAFHLTKNFTLYLLFLHFLLKKFVHIKKKQYLCSDFDLLGGSRCGRAPVFEHLIQHYHTYERRTRRFVFGYLKLAISSISSRHNSCSIRRD